MTCNKTDCRYHSECGVEYGSKWCSYETFTKEELEEGDCC